MHQNRRAYPKAWDRQGVILRKLTSAVRSHAADCAAGPDLVLVDYGCGDERPYRHLFPAYRYIGADLADNPLADLHLTPEGGVPCEDASADVVLSTQVLEHVADPRLYLEECWRLLKPGGRLILSTHGTWTYHPHPADYWRWTSEGLKRIVAAQGFDIVRFQGLLGPAATAVQLIETRAMNFRLRSGPAGMLLTLAFEGLIRTLDALENSTVRDKDAAVFILSALRPVAASRAARSVRG